jgi:hypothetical protein
MAGVFIAQGKVQSNHGAVHQRVTLKGKGTVALRGAGPFSANLWALERTLTLEAVTGRANGCRRLPRFGPAIGRKTREGLVPRGPALQTFATDPPPFAWESFLGSRKVETGHHPGQRAPVAWTTFAGLAKGEVGVADPGFRAAPLHIAPILERIRLRYQAAVERWARGGAASRLHLASLLSTSYR